MNDFAPRPANEDGLSIRLLDMTVEGVQHLVGKGDLLPAVVCQPARAPLSINICVNEFAHQPGGVVTLCFSTSINDRHIVRGGPFRLNFYEEGGSLVCTKDVPRNIIVGRSPAQAATA